MEQLWAPWRLEFVKSASGHDPLECVFCAAPQLEDDQAALILHRGATCFVILNLYPYTNGHLLIAPYRHLATPGALDAEERAELWELFDRCLDVLDRTLHPHGANAGVNLGRSAGAGIEGHLHLHVVPPLERRHQLHAGARRYPRDGAAPRRQLAAPAGRMATLCTMTLDPSIFKAYDIRGIVPDQFDPDGAYRVARAYVEVFRAKRIAIGHDMRLSSPALAEAAIRGALDGGVDGLDVYRILVPAAAARARKGVLVEVGAGQAPAVAAMMTAAGLSEVRIWKDLSGTERVVGGRRPA